MSEKIAKFIGILHIEMEDIEEDLKTLKEINLRRQERHEITDYVYLENSSVLKKELYGCEMLEKALDKVDPAAFSSLEEARDYLDSYFKRLTKESDFPEAIYHYLKRKLDKVYTYVHNPKVAV